MDPTIITYQDELQPDKTVQRRYDSGHIEWRRKLSDGRVEWGDTQGRSGIDELLDAKTVKRTFSDGRVIYGREQGYGRTAWSGGQHVVTVNQSSFGGKVGVILAGMGAGMLLGAIVWPPDELSMLEEEELRQHYQQVLSSSSGDSGFSHIGGWNGGDDDGGMFDFG